MYLVRVPSAVPTIFQCQVPIEQAPQGIASGGRRRSATLRSAAIARRRWLFDIIPRVRAFFWHMVVSFKHNNNGMIMVIDLGPKKVNGCLGFSWKIAWKNGKWTMDDKIWMMVWAIDGTPYLAMEKYMDKYGDFAHREMFRLEKIWWFRLWISNFRQLSGMKFFGTWPTMEPHLVRRWYGGFHSHGGTSKWRISKGRSR